MNRHLPHPALALTSYSLIGVVVEGRSWSARSGYRYGFNGKEKDDEHFEGAYDFGSRILDARLSIDPSHEKCVGLSVYHFAACSPILFVGPDGKENIIYIVATPEGNIRLEKEGLTAEQIAQKATEFYSGVHLKTVVKVFDGESKDFNIKVIDNTDVVAVIGGSAKDNKEYVRDVLELGFQNHRSNEDDAMNPEESQNSPFSESKIDFFRRNIITLNAKVLKSTVFDNLLFKKEKDNSKNKQTKTKVAAFYIMHVAGHNMGYSPSDLQNLQKK